MPKGPKGEKRKADVVGNAVLIAQIATGEADDAPEDNGKDPAGRPLAQRVGRLAGV